MRFIISPMTTEDAVTTVLNTCMHTMDKKLPWNDARQLLTQLMQDAYDMGFNAGKEAKIEEKIEQPLPEVTIVDAVKIDKTV